MRNLVDVRTGVVVARGSVISDVPMLVVVAVGWWLESRVYG